MRPPRSGTIRLPMENSRLLLRVGTAAPQPRGRPECPQRGARRLCLSFPPELSRHPAATRSAADVTATLCSALKIPARPHRVGAPDTRCGRRTFQHSHTHTHTRTHAHKKGSSAPRRAGSGGRGRAIAPLPRERRGTMRQKGEKRAVLLCLRGAAAVGSGRGCSSGRATRGVSGL